MADQASNAPPTPKTILRGHKAQVHAVAFIRDNERLVTGDADGFVVVWDLTIMRPRAVWQPHANAVLGVAAWGNDRIITHGRDNKLIVWKLTAADEPSMSTALPLDAAASSTTIWPQPWMLHLLEVNTMNFCTFSACQLPVASLGTQSDPELLVAVPNTLKSEAIDVYHLSTQRRLHTVKLGGKNGMVMALTLFARDGRLGIAAGYENGCTLVTFLGDGGEWTVRYLSQAHSQPILSLAISPDRSYFLTSSADALIVKHPLPGSDENSGPLKVVNTKHAGQQGLTIRSDSKVFATAGWDSRVRVYSNKTMKEVAVLKWHQVGCYAVAFASIQADGPTSVDSAIRPEIDQNNSASSTAVASAGSSNAVVVPKLLDLTVKERRIKDAASAHWLAVGSKDGRVSLWDVF